MWERATRPLGLANISMWGQPPSAACPEPRRVRSSETRRFLVLIYQIRILSSVQIVTPKAVFWPEEPALACSATNVGPTEIGEPAS